MRYGLLSDGLIRCSLLQWLLAWWQTVHNRIVRNRRRSANMNPGKKLHVVAAGCPALLLLLGGLASCGDSAPQSAVSDEPQRELAESSMVAVAPEEAIDEFGLPRDRFVGSGRAPDGRSVQALTPELEAAARDESGDLLPTELPDIVECSGPGGLPLRATKQTYLASVTPSGSSDIAAPAFCDGSAAPGLAWMVTSDGVESLTIDGKRGSLDNEGYVLMPNGQRHPRNYRLNESGELVEP